MSESDYYRSMWMHEEFAERWSLRGAAPSQDRTQGVGSIAGDIYRRGD
ncbi:hypothetical protein P4132_04870 [Pseudomonas aeruginosa]|nr:hypothetical protein [Pseudomonas aeruginosa]